MKWSILHIQKFNKLANSMIHSLNQKEKKHRILIRTQQHQFRILKSAIGLRFQQTRLYSQVSTAFRKNSKSLKRVIFILFSKKKLKSHLSNCRRRCSQKRRQNIRVCIWLEKNQLIKTRMRKQRRVPVRTGSFWGLRRFNLHWRVKDTKHLRSGKICDQQELHKAGERRDDRVLKKTSRNR
jgi:hypothetical protein